nr:hypothetical protein CFP56_11264 [Quercus suber]
MSLKCDELRPKCSLCLKADVSCSYPVYHNFMPSFQPPAPAEKSRPASNNHTLFWQNSVQPSEISSGVLRIKVAAKLKLRTIKVAPTGTGSFYTFSLAPCRQASQAQVHEVNSGLSFRSVESGMSKLCKAFSAIIADESQSSFCFSLQSDWLSYIPSRLAHSDLLRAAAICTVLTFSSRGSANERLKHDALKSYVSVVQQLRLTLASKDKQMNDEVVAAMVCWSIPRPNSQYYVQGMSLTLFMSRNCSRYTSQSSLLFRVTCIQLANNQVSAV